MKRLKRRLTREFVKNCSPHIHDIILIGQVDGATLDGRALQTHLYQGTLTDQPVPSMEIKEIAWLTKDQVLSRSAKDDADDTRKSTTILEAHHIW